MTFILLELRLGCEDQWLSIGTLQLDWYVGSLLHIGHKYPGIWEWDILWYGMFEKWWVWHK